MSVWKSPILYLGILLLLAVSAAVLAPFVVDWSTYRTDLERYGERLSGRTVRINGPISVRLFPFPQFSGERVTISETDDPKSPTFVDADRVTVRVALAGLLSWQLRVEDITVDTPVINLVRGADGTGNWLMLPQEELRTSRLLESVRLDRIFLNNGKVNYVDKNRNGKLEVGVDAATFSAPSIEGPWRSSGTISAYGVQSDFAFTSGVVTPNNPVKFGLKLIPKDNHYPLMSFDGARGADLTSGNLRIEGAVAPEAEKQDQQAPIPASSFPLKITASVDATGNHIAVSKLQIVPAKNDDSTTLIQGDATIDIGNRVVASAQLNAPRINLDSLLGGKVALNSSQLLALVNSALKAMPGNLDLQLVLDAASVKSGGEAIEGVVIAGDANQQAARIKRVSANLPGRSRVLADGTIFAAPTNAEFAGKMAAETSDLRQLASWLWPQNAATLAKYWTGSRGQFKLQSNVSVSDQLVSFSGLQFELDGQRGSGEAKFQSGDAAGREISLKIGTLDIDNFVKDGVRFKGNGATPADLVTAFAGLVNSADTQVTLASDAIILNGIHGTNFRVDGGIGKQGLLVRALELALLGEARITAQGQVLLNQGTPEGSLDAGVTAQDPLPLLQLLGLVKAGDNAPWQRVLGATEISTKLAFGSSEAGPVANLRSVGRSGPININSAVSLTNLGLTGKPSVKGFAELASDDETDVARLFGIEQHATEKRKGLINTSFDGNAVDGYKVAIQADVLAAKTVFEGVYKPSQQDLPQLDGKLSISADDTGMVMQAIGVPLAEEQKGLLSVEANITPQGDTLRFENVKGLYAGENFTGDLDIKGDRSVRADFSVQSLSLQQVVASTLLEWDGVAATRDSNFEGSAPFGVKGEFWLRPQSFSLFDGMPLKETVIGIVVEGRERQMTLLARTESGEEVSAEAALLPSGGQYSLNVTGKLPLQLEQLLAFEDQGRGLNGHVLVDGKAVGTGLSPGAALTDLTGEGRLKISGVTIKQFAPESYASSIAGAQSSDALRASIASLQGNEVFNVADADIPFKINLGRLVVDPFTNLTQSSTLTYDVSADLADHSLTAVVAVAANQLAQLPPAKLWLEGPVDHLRRRVETSAIAAKLGYDIMAKEMADLEKAQQEQQRIIEQEEAQRKLDAEKFQAYQEQRVELRLRQRELKVQAVQRARDTDLAKQQFEAQVGALAAMNKQELARDVRIARITSATVGGLPSRAVKSKRKFVVLEQLPPGFILPDAPPVAQP